MKEIAKILLLLLAVVATVSAAICVLAWELVLPVIGLLYLVGLLK